MFNRSILNGMATICAFLICLTTTVQADVIHVKADAMGSGDGSSWEDAYVHLQDALANAAENTEIWVAAGIYKPDQGRDRVPGNREAYFDLTQGITLLGGFVGNEESLDQRAGLFEQTVLDGDLAGNDLPDFVNREDNSRHVLIAETYTAANIVLDGFLIRGGCTLNSQQPYGAGAILNAYSADVIVRNCSFRENEALGYNCAGGGIYAASHGSDGREVFLDNCTLEANRTDGNGGGLYVTSSSQVRATDCAFRANSSYGGGGISGSWSTLSNLILERCLIENNEALTDDYYPAEGGGVSWRGSIQCADCTFRSNFSAWGGGLYLDPGYSSISAIIEDCLFDHNAVADSSFSAAGGGAFLEGATPIIRRCTFRQNVARSLSVNSNGYGGGMYCRSMNALILDCLFENNVAEDDGGGAFAREQITWFVNCRFIGNSALGNEEETGGGAIFNDYYANPRIVNCVFVANAATGVSTLAGGGAVHSTFSSSPKIANSLFLANASNNRGGGVFFTSRAEVRIWNSIFQNNTAVAAAGERAQIEFESDCESTILYSCIEGWTNTLSGAGCFDADPLFVDPLGPDLLPGTGDEDLHLAPGSPCLDRGWNWGLPGDRRDLDGDGDRDEFIPYDMDSAARFADDPNAPDNTCGATPIVDIGPYERGDAFPQPCKPDLTGDGIIDLADLACLLNSYGSNPADGAYNPSCDLNANGQIDLGDLAELLGHYGETCR